MKLLTLLVATASLSYADFIAPSFTVDLDIQDAYTRWSGPANSIIKKHGYANSWGRLHSFLEQALPHKLWVELEPMWDRVLASYPSEYQQEIRAFHRWVNEQNLKVNWTLGQCTMVQLFYEVEDACTSIVSESPDGAIRHARNLDYGLPGLVSIRNAGHEPPSHQLRSHPARALWRRRTSLRPSRSSAVCRPSHEGPCT